MSARFSGRDALVLVAVLALALITARLGLWQLDRAAQKTALYEAMRERAALPPLDATSLERNVEALPAQLHRRVVLEGRWLDRYTVFLDNRQMRARVGFFVVTPLELAEGDVVLVQRGWLPRDAQVRDRIEPPPATTGRVRIEGRVAAGPSRLFEFDAAASGPIRQNLDITSFARETGLPLRPLAVVQMDSSQADALERAWLPAQPDVAKHHGYALQWFALSALVIIFYVWNQFIRPRRRRAG